MRFAVIAGTPVDTQMGVDELTQRGSSAVAFPVSANPIEQTQFQVMPKEQRYAHISKLVEHIKEEAFDGILVYCNSLSSVIEFGKLSYEHNIDIVTPMDVYRKIAPRYSKVAVIAANNQGAAGVERSFVNASPETIVIGYASLNIVNDVENGVEPSELIERNGLKEVAAAFEKSGAEALVLGCTHFPYFKEDLKKLTQLPVIDPMDEMYRLLSE